MHKCKMQEELCWTVHQQQKLKEWDIQGSFKTFCFIIATTVMICFVCVCVCVCMSERDTYIVYQHDNI